MLALTALECLTLDVARFVHCCVQFHAKVVCTGCGVRGARSQSTLCKGARQIFKGIPRVLHDMSELART